MSLTLEQQLTEIVRKHGLIHIALNVTTIGDGLMFYVNAQCIDGDDRHAASSGYKLETFADAIPDAIKELDAKRGTALTALAPIEGLAA